MHGKSFVAATDAARAAQFAGESPSTVPGAKGSVVVATDARALANALAQQRGQGAAAQIVDAIQIPAFLCRQTDLIAAAARTGKPVSVKKGQFLSPEETKNILDKGREAGNDRVFITERGSSFGYQNLVVDMRAFPIIREFGAPVVYDITHSMQKPGGEGKQTGGTPQFARPLARAAAAAGADGFFMEVHDNPPAALSDRTTQIRPEDARAIIEDVLAIRKALKARG